MALLHCPFCGSAGEIFKGRSYPANCRTFQTETEAEDWIAEMRKKYIIKAEAISERHFKRGAKYTARVEKQAYIPRCTKPGCIARSVVLFSSLEAAEEAWNGRADNVR